ncbi:MAG: type II toxin-antitoxin system RelE/ParE family toxin [Phycisphaerales bacterium]
MNYSFHPEAEEEFLGAIEYYEVREEGLGLEFASEVRAAVVRAAEHPRTWPIIEGEVRRCLTTRFPYGVLYSERRTASLRER